MQQTLVYILYIIYFILFSQVCKTVFKFTFHRWRSWGLEQYSSPTQKLHRPAHGPWHTHVRALALGQNIDVFSCIPQISYVQGPILVTKIQSTQLQLSRRLEFNSLFQKYVHYWGILRHLIDTKCCANLSTEVTIVCTWAPATSAHSSLWGTDLTINNPIHSSVKWKILF